MIIGSKKWKNCIYDGVRELEVQIDQGETDKFVIHALELIKWNKKINLTAITDPLEIAVKHFIDSIVPVPMIPPKSSLLDIGSGGGFPGIPLKILMPSLSVTIIDASRKKVSFLKHVIRVLSLNSIEAHHIRTKDVAISCSLPNTYDVIISRAVSSMDTFILTAYPLVAKDGIIIAMQGKAYEKIDSVYSIKNKISDILGENKNSFTLVFKKYKLPYLKSKRCIVVIKKVRQ